ncbi:DUF1801 domain-containing protein [Rhodococcus sovatensis]|uniref:DUF1801 domain-containing protein n=1 Tax=Rhodococcus sovatensis TaxID=1805840 RepID=A0ABZ2PLY0_9NOCA
MAEKKPTKDPAAAVVEKIASYPEPYNAVGKRLHEVILEAAPELQPRLFYGMPGYAKGKGPILCHFIAEKYIAFGLSEKANVAVGEDASDKLMPSGWFLTELDEATEKRIAAIVRRAVQ